VSAPCTSIGRPASTNAAKAFNLYPRKGAIQPGSDADLVIWDTGVPRTIRNVDLHHAADYTPYEGREVRAWPSVTMSRGVTVWCEGEFRGRAGHGQFLRCERPGVVTSQFKIGPATL